MDVRLNHHASLKCTLRLQPTPTLTSRSSHSICDNAKILQEVVLYNEQLAQHPQD